MTSGFAIQPNILLDYTFADTEDYTSHSGVRIQNDNLHLWKVAPGIKVSKDFARGWNAYLQAKYAFVSTNGGDATANDIALPNVSAKDYAEYGIGIDKTLNDAWKFLVVVNRRDGGREGWNGQLEFKYYF